MQQRLNQRNNAACILARGACLLFILASASVAYASQTSGTIDSVHKYAWGNVAGYVNFAPTNGGLTVTDSAITGYAWGANTGWINFNASQSHVTNDSNGTLGGFAWDSGAGWVSFTGVTIDTSGKFHGTATGASYSISFDCTNCDVRTDWRPASSRPSSSSGGGGCAPGFVWNPATISCVPLAGGPYSPIVTPPPPSAIPTASPSPSPTTPGVPGKNPPSASPATSGTAANGQGFVSNPSLTSTTTTFKDAISTSSAIHATTTANKSALSSFIDFIRSFWWSILILAGVLAIFYFFVRF